MLALERESGVSVPSYLQFLPIFSCKVLEGLEAACEGLLLSGSLLLREEACEDLSSRGQSFV
jgi:hypothetical protein